MQYLFIAIALLFMQTACAADGSKAKSTKVKNSIDSVKVENALTLPAPLFTDIIPQPISIVKGEGRFTINDQTALICDKELEGIADYFTQYVLVYGKAYGVAPFPLCTSEMNILGEVVGNTF